MLALLLFVVLINDIGFDGQLNNARELATSKRNIKIAKKFICLSKTAKYSNNWRIVKHMLWRMKWNWIIRKQKLLSSIHVELTIDFMPEIIIDDHEHEVVDEIRLLGRIIRVDMKWTSNTLNMILKANKRLWILRRLKNLGAQQSDLLNV